MLDTFDHDLYVETLRAFALNYENDNGKFEFSVTNIISPFFGELKVGDLCQFVDISSKKDIFGMIVNIRIIVTSKHRYVHAWMDILVESDFFIFHTRVDREHYNEI